ncbi:MAG: hypothetical protein FWE06_08745 [Oscillospiraceae bacterium]|nr:hypothetical protein [Oscillospiraceae bacterium]
MESNWPSFSSYQPMRYTPTVWQIWLERWWIYAAIALVVAIIVVAVAYSMSKTQAKQSCQAQDYVKPDSFKITHQENQYMGTTITRIPIAQNNNRR